VMISSFSSSSPSSSNPNLISSSQEPLTITVLLLHPVLTLGWSGPFSFHQHGKPSL
jgi:hypothetical protein